MLPVLSSFASFAVSILRAFPDFAFPAFVFPAFGAFPTGLGIGLFVGDRVGLFVGLFEGNRVGVFVEDHVGLFVGLGGGVSGGLFEVGQYASMRSLKSSSPQM
jgi:hypothetical protein